MMFPIKDINGLDIKDGDEVLYNGEHFIAMYVGKENVEWILHPCDNNQLDQFLDFATIPSPMDGTGIQLELVKR